MPTQGFRMVQWFGVVASTCGGIGVSCPSAVAGVCGLFGPLYVGSVLWVWRPGWGIRGGVRGGVGWGGELASASACFLAAAAGVGLRVVGDGGGGGALGYVSGQM